MTTGPTPQTARTRQDPQPPDTQQYQQIPGQLSIYDALPEGASPTPSRPVAPRRVQPAPTAGGPQLRLPTLSLPTPTTTLHLLDLRSWAAAHLPSAAALTWTARNTASPLEACCPTCGYRDDPWRLRIYHLAPCQTPPAPRSPARVLAERTPRP